MNTETDEGWGLTRAQIINKYNIPMKKEFSEQDIYDTNQLFQARLKKEADEQKRVFYRILMITLAIFLVGGIVGYILAQ